LVVREVFEVLYSPINAFKKIIEKPDIKGVLLVLVLVISSILVAQYVAGSKLNVEDRLPESDDWTEALTNQHSWSSNGLLDLDTTDFQMGNVDGNHSIVSSVKTDTSIWLKITDIDPIDCSEEEGYIELFFWIKWINNDGSPSSGTMKLFSGSEDSYFETDLTTLLGSSGRWANATLNVGSDQGWSSNNSPDWQNITGIEFKLVWSSTADVTMKLDGLFFSRYVPYIEYVGTSGVLLIALVNLALPFAIDLILWSGLLLLVAKLFQEELGTWNNLILIIGYSFIVTFVYNILNIFAIAGLPPINLSVDPAVATATINQVWAPLLSYQVSTYLPLVERIWIALLGAIVIRLMKDTTWGRALAIVAVAFGIRYLLSLFLF
jgi:hypothetical protein